jgi:hypothetical protein
MSGRRLQDSGARECRRVVSNQTDHTKSKKCTRALGLVHRPGHDEVRDLAQRRNGLPIEQALMDGNTLEPLAREATKGLSELPRVADGMNAAHGCAFEGLE